MIFQDETVPDEKILTRVANLIAKADRTDNESEREAYLAKADQLMTKHRIELADLEAAKGKASGVRQKPISVEMPFPGYDFSNLWHEHFCRMLGYVARNCRVRVTNNWKLEAPTAVLVGFEDDVAYAQMIWLSIYYGFTSKLDPTWDDAKSADENIKALKESGRKWAFIGDVANAHGFPNKPNDGKLKAAYKRQCVREGVEPTAHTQRNSAYRQSFADYFQGSVIERLNNQYDQSRRDEKDHGGSALALRDRSAYVDEEFYAMYPHLKPLTKEEREREMEEVVDRLKAKKQAERERRAKLTQAQRDAEDLAAERQRLRDERWDQEQQAKRYDVHGAKTGAKAGRSVDLTGGKNGLKEDASKRIGN